MKGNRIAYAEFYLTPKNYNEKSKGAVGRKLNP